MLHDVLAKYSPNLTADGLTSQVCSISLPGTCYVRRECTGCIVPDFPIQAPISRGCHIHLACRSVCDRDQNGIKRSKFF